MKIAMPVNGKSMDKGICPSFGRAPYFLIYDTKTEEGLFIDNSAASSQGGAGIKAAQLVVDNGADVLITPRCGENAASVINAGKVKIYRSTDGSIEDNLNALKEDKLSILDEIRAGFHNHGGR